MGTSITGQMPGRDGVALLENMPPCDMAQVDIQRQFKQFPVFLIAVTLMWVGMLACADYFLHEGDESLLSLGCALVFFLCGAAILAAQGRPVISRALAFIALAISLHSLIHNLFFPLSASQPMLTGKGFYVDSAPAVLSGILALAIIGSRWGPAGRRVARYSGYAVILGAIALRMAPEFFAFNPHSMPGAVNLASVLGVLAGYAVVALSRESQRQRIFSDRTIAAMAILGTFVSALAWYAMIERDRSWLEPLANYLPDLVLLVCLIFTFFLTRSQTLAMMLRHRSIQLHHGSLHDYLTQMPNRRHLQARLKEICRVTRQRGGKLWAVVFDLDGMKFINDSMGRDIGDEVLKKVASRIVKNMGGTQFVARVEGAEFVVVFANIEREEMFAAIERILAALARPYCIENMELRLAASAGITASDGNVDRPMEIVRQADLAMARARQAGRNTWHVYTADLSATVAERLTMRNDLQIALDEGAFALHYQPLIDGNSGCIVGAEALLRWPHSAHGPMIPPSDFIPLAEETGQIIPLSNWVLDTACRDISRLRASGLADFPVIVNISPLHFLRNDFVSGIRAKLQVYSLPADCLEIEITEGVLLDNAAYIIAKLVELKELGVRVSIDDFGTGYSSLNYLKNLPIDKIKIDRSFVNEVISDRNDAAITKAIIGLAHHLNLKVVAEGVETESQFWFLKRHFCDEFQGYLFARPMPFEDFSAKLRDHGGRQTLPIAPA